MNNFYQKLFNRSKADIPQSVGKKFKTSFRHPVSVEWMRAGTDFEALFYENDQEKIARFESSGNLKEIRINHTPQDFPGIKNQDLLQPGTIMNFIEIRRDETVNYEVIMKRPDQGRQFVLLKNQFEVIREEPL